MVPIIIDLFHPESVVDIGCGVGTWLSIFARSGLKDFCGVDANHVDRSALEFNQDCFYAHDLRTPLYLEKSFDLVLCLEVAEHLHISCAETLIDSLARLGNIVVFSAAVPFQGGHRHLNEQWPEFWEQLFRDRGFVVRDILRGRVWHDTRVEPWYRQNTLVFVRNAQRERIDALIRQNDHDQHAPISIVHPDLYLSWVGRAGLISKGRDLLSKLLR